MSGPRFPFPPASIGRCTVCRGCVMFVLAVPAVPERGIGGRIWSKGAASGAGALSCDAGSNAGALFGSRVTDSGSFLPGRSFVGRLCAGAAGVPAMPVRNLGICCFSDAGIHEKFPYVSEQALLPVDEILVVAVSEGTSLDLYFRRIDIEDSRLVVEREYDLAHGHGLSLVCTVEDDILALAGSDSAQCLRAENPLHGVDDIALSGAVGAQKRCNSI